VKQILQHLGNGKTTVVEVPCPAVGAGQILLRTTRTLISAGTERMLVEFGKANPLEKARQQPDKVKQVLDKVKTDGLMPTIASVRNKLDVPLPLGYCHVGRVLELGRGVTGFDVGDRVASNGKHAEVVAVPTNLCARIPDSVSDDEAAFTVIGAVALQGIRLAQPTLGETVVVTGLGLIGQITVQLLRAHGCRVLGLDVDPGRLALARQFGAEVAQVGGGADPVAAALHMSRGRGVDAVIVTAATKSSDPMHQAALMCRQRGRIVLIGVTGLELSRDDFFKKELTFQVSCSYGPGRYDPEYEDKGHDYPFGLVRWTEQRNFEAVLDMMADRRLDVRPLISHRFSLASADEAYAVVGGSAPSMGIVLDYPSVSSADEAAMLVPTVRISTGTQPGGTPSVTFIGAGNYATAVLIPAFKAAGAKLSRVVSHAGVSAVHAARKFGFENATTDVGSAFEPGGRDAVIVATRHDSHARYVIRAIDAGRHVFVEKPLCLDLEELAAIEAAYVGQVAQGKVPAVMVGFNRRFAPQVVTLRAALDRTSGPKAFVMTVNAGAIPRDHWTQDRAIGGGRIVGEACHFIDLLRFLAASPIAGAQVASMAAATRDSVSIVLNFADGSLGTIHYFANGSKAFSKERLDVFASGRVAQIDNYRVLRSFGWPGLASSRLWSQDKGQGACAAAFVDALRRGGAAPIPFDEIVEVSRWSIVIAGQA
jgi:threonine dehydrogenase-like Zn-dependent dehydrogenase/predicted dehydrogenase